MYTAGRSKLERTREQVKGLTVATDMETGTLFTTSHMRKTVSGSLLTVVDFSADQENEKAQTEALKVAYKASLETLLKFVG
jgi:uridine phosphorylase